MKNTLYIIFFFLTGCLDYQGPFQDEKTTLKISEYKIFGVYVSEIIGISNENSRKLKKMISDKLKDNDLLSSDNAININSFVLKGTFIDTKKKIKKFYYGILKRLTQIVLLNLELI